MQTVDKTIPLRCDAATVQAIDWLVHRVKQCVPGGEATRTSIMRAALKLGLDHLMLEYKRGNQPSPGR